MLAHPAILWLINTAFDASNGYGTKVSPRSRSVSVLESRHHIVNSTNPGGGLHDGVEHGLHVGGRPADDAEHLGGGGLMLQRLAQFCVALLDLFEQPHVLDSDDRLVSEDLQKVNLLVGEWTDLG